MIIPSMISAYIIFSAPMTPTNIQLQQTGATPSTSLTATWSTPSDNADDVVYKVRIDRGSNQGTPITAYGETNVFSNLIPGAEYKVSVWAEAGDVSTTGQQSGVLASTNVYTSKIIIYSVFYMSYMKVKYQYICFTLIVPLIIVFFPMTHPSVHLYLNGRRSHLKVPTPCKLYHISKIFHCIIKNLTKYE